MQDNRGEEWTLISAVCGVGFFFVCLYMALSVHNDETVVTTESNGYRTVTQVEGVFGKSTCTTTRVGEQSVTRCD